MNNVKSIVLKEIDDYEKAHNILEYDIRSKLIDEKVELYLTDIGTKLELVTIFCEGEVGYTISYDSEEKEFCLGYRSGKGILQYYGHYGSFMETFLGM